MERQREWREGGREGGREGLSGSEQMREALEEGGWVGGRKCVCEGGRGQKGNLEFKLSRLVADRADWYI